MNEVKRFLDDKNYSIETLIKNLKESWKTKDIEEVVEWFSTLNIPTRKPSSINKTDFTLLKSVKSLVQDFISAKQNATHITLPIIKKEFSFKVLGKLDMIRMTKEEITQNFTGGKSKPTTISKKNATYVKKGSLSYSKFLDYIEEIEYFLETLDYPHNKILNRLEIHFVDSKELKSKANYSSQYDILRINPKKLGNTKDDYGSLPYVTLHELGHRYLKKYPQKWNYDNFKWVTTRYSQIDSMTGEEKFAELFALSHWPYKYPEYKNKIEDFLNVID